MEEMAGSSTAAELELVGAGGEPVDLWRTISSHGVADLPPNRIDDEKRTLEVTVSVARGKPRTAVISQGRPGYARVVMRSGKPGAVLDTVRHMLGLDADLSLFYELVAEDPDLAWVANGAGRMLRSPTVFEEVFKTVCTPATPPRRPQSCKRFSRWMVQLATGP
jgi:3-methyladenine DNA glycosylase/8-oxoguanine DNA glycosylase